MKIGLRGRDGDGVVVEGRARVRTLLVLTGTGGAVFVALATLHCGPFTAVASLVQRTPLYPLVKPAVAMPLVFGFVALSAGGLALGFTRHRQLYPLLLLLGGVCLIAYTWRTAIETALWFTLAFSSLAALLLLAAALELCLGRARGPVMACCRLQQPRRLRGLRSQVSLERVRRWNVKPSPIAQRS